MAADHACHHRAASACQILRRAAVLGTTHTATAVPHSLGQMTKICEHAFCRALHFAAERGMLLYSCCHNGQALAPALSTYPVHLHPLLSGDIIESTIFVNILGSTIAPKHSPALEQK